jgi:hypothetical protein
MQIHLVKVIWRTSAVLAIVLAGALAFATQGNTSSRESVSNVSVADTAAAAKEHSKILIVDYHVVKDCVVHANYPINPGNHAWTVPKGSKIGWRYNVTGKVAAVSDVDHPNQFPHWGFVEDSGCIGKSVGQTKKLGNGKTISYPAGVPVPARILSGRSQNDAGWRSVDWRPSGGAIPGAHRALGHNATLRDTPGDFVIGNVYAAWQVRPTGARKNGYTLVYVPSLQRWGWLQL